MALTETLTAAEKAELVFDVAVKILAQFALVAAAITIVAVVVAGAITLAAAAAYCLWSAGSPVRRRPHPAQVVATGRLATDRAVARAKNQDRDRFGRAA